MPLPGEIVPLHIFEPRYRQLLKDLEEGDGHFGILYSGITNHYALGAVMKLERVIKRYPTGESDIVCRAEDVFMLADYFKQNPGKLYPGGNIRVLDFPDFEISSDFEDMFRKYMASKKQADIGSPLMINDVAIELDLDVNDRLRYLQLLHDEKREKFLMERVRFRKHVLDQEIRSGNSFIYN